MRGETMDRIELVIPSEKYKEIINGYKGEFIETGDSMDGTAGLQNADTFEEWYSALIDNSSEETVREGLVPATTFLAIRKSDSKLVGMINIRHKLNDYLLKSGGNIGYSIRKTEREKGFATEMLKIALEKCKDMRIDKVLITCNKDNIASAKTIINNGGILENEILEENRITQRYWITL
jgi:predicted acetyltransferase